MKNLLIISLSILVVGCSVFGHENVENAPYEIVKSVEEQNIEIRTYDSMILVSAPMGTDGRNDAFRKLFDYISGENVTNKDIAMTAPVFMDEENEGTKIPMTAPVFMDETSDKPQMSFVMPDDFTLETTPKPTNPEVSVSEIKDYTVATIRFNGRLSDSNIEKHRKILETWVTNNNYTVIGAPKTAGYNAPFTLPAFRRNEVLIPVKIQ